MANKTLNMKKIQEGIQPNTTLNIFWVTYLSKLTCIPSSPGFFVCYFMRSTCHFIGKWPGSVICDFIPAKKYIYII